MNFANAISLIALFVALGGSAYAINLDRDDVRSSHIKDGQVKSDDLKNDDVRSGDISDGEVQAADIASSAVGGGELATDSVQGDEVEDESLSGDEFGFDTLDGFDIDEDSLNADLLPATASLASQIRDVGTGGDVLFGGGSGRTTAATDMAEAQMIGGPGMEVFGIQAMVETVLGVGETRTFTLVRRGFPATQIIDTAVTCTIPEGQRFCDDITGISSLNSNLFAIEIESVGAGLPSTDDAYVGLKIGG